MMSRTFFVQNIKIFAEKIVILGAEKCECAFFRQRHNVKQ